MCEQTVEQINKIIENDLKELRQRQQALYKIDSSTLTHEQAKKLEFETFQNSQIEIELVKELRK